MKSSLIYNVNQIFYHKPMKSSLIYNVNQIFYHKPMKSSPIYNVNQIFHKNVHSTKEKITIIERYLSLEKKGKHEKRSINTVVTYGVRVLQKPAKLNNKNLLNKIEHMFKNKVMIFLQIYQIYLQSRDRHRFLRSTVLMQNINLVFASTYSSFMVYCVLRHFQQYFSYIVAVSYISGGNRSTRGEPPICRKSLTNFITYCCIECTSL